jgi:hypothetical protein
MARFGDRLSNMDQKPSIRSFSLAFREHLFAALSGGASVPFSVAAAYFENTAARIVLPACALTCVWFAAYRVWKPEREKVCELQHMLSPKIDIFLDPTNNGVRVVETSINPNPLVRGPDSKWVQFSVKSMTDAPLVGCEARLLAAERLKVGGGTESISDEPIFCRWSNTDETRNTRMTIPPGVSQPANILSISQGQATLQPETAPYMKPRFLREIQKAGQYRLKVVVSAEGAQAQTASFVVDWGGSYDLIRIEKEQTLGI